MLALVGESGSGKTTTAQTILGNVAMDAGSVTLNGVDIATVRRPATRPCAARSSSSTRIPTSRSTRGCGSATPRRADAGASHRSLAGRSRGPLAGALAQVGLTPVDLFLERYPHQLSGGQRQRVAIAAGLVLEPKLLIADEPVSMLDVSIRAEILDLLDGLRRDGDLAVLMITHDLSTVIHHADRIAVMYRGRIVEQGPTREVIADPHHPYTAALLSVVPSRHSSADRQRTLLSGEPPSPVSLPSGCHFHPRCPVARGDCCQVDPPERTVGNGEHTVSCVLA